MHGWVVKRIDENRFYWLFVNIIEEFEVLKFLILKISYGRDFSDSPDSVFDKIFAEFKKKLGVAN